MLARVILFFLDFLKPLFRALGINYAQLRAIVDIKLIMDGRRQSIRYSKKQQETNNGFFWTLVIYAVFGAFVAIAVAASSFSLGMTIFFGYLMVMVIVTLITDFSSVLLDTSDNTIILPRPVDSRTFYAARVTHILLYLGQLTICLSISSCVAVAWKYGILLSLLFIIGIILTILIAVFLTNALYLLIMRFSSEEKLKDIINYFQIAMTIFFMGGYQIGSRLITRFDYENTVIDIQWWSYLIPPLWLSNLMEMFYSKVFDAPHIILSLLAFGFPIASIYITARWLTPFFNKKLMAMGGAVGNKPNVAKSRKDSFLDTISRWTTFSPREQGAFAFIYKMLSRDNKIKLKIYPAFGLIFVFGFIFLFNGKESFQSTLTNLPNTYYYILFIYLPFMVVQTAFVEIAFSEDFKASWIYYSAPIERPGEVLSGMAKAIYVKLFLPIYLVVSIIILFVWKENTIDDILFGLINNYLIYMILCNINTRRMPLSVAATMRAQSGNLARGIITLIATAVPGLTHYLLAKTSWTLLIAVPFQLIAIYFLQKNYRQAPWSSVKF